MKTSTRSLTLVSGVVCASLSALRDVEGVATKYTQYEDSACTVESGATVLNFGVGSFEEPFALGEFNECVAGDDGTTSSIFVCNASDQGEVGTNSYLDDTCTEIAFEGATTPSCLETSPGADCTAGGFTCATITECTDDEPSSIEPNEYNIRAIEYEDAECTMPTGSDGETVVLASDALSGVAVDGSCYEPVQGLGYVLGQCLDDGSVLSQTFAPDDSTCSGDVWAEAMTPSDMSAVCAAVEIDGLFYSYVSCTMDAVTVGGTAAAPTASPTDIAESPSSASDGESTIDMTMAPTAFGATMAPTSASSSDRDLPGADDDEEVNGAAAGAGNGVSVMATVVLSCAAGLLTFVAV